MSTYAEWVRRYATLDEPKRAEARRMIEAFPRKPLISVVVATYETPEPVLRAMLDSIEKQLYPHWELCIADDASKDPNVRRVLEEVAAKDKRIKLVFRETNGHISEATNSALALATGEWIAFVDHDDEIPEHALFMVVRYIHRFPRGRMFYSDDDKIGPDGSRHDPYFKPDWSPELARSQNLFSNLGVYEAALVREVGGVRKGFEGSQDHDLTLRCVEKAGNDAVVHIPHVLYHWRMIPGSTSRGVVEEKPYAVGASVRAVYEHLERIGLRGVVTLPLAHTNMLRVRYALPEPVPFVSIIVRGRSFAEARLCVESVLRKTMYGRYEILLDLDRTLDKTTADELGLYGKVRFTQDPVRDAKGTVLCFLRRDLTVISPDWLDELVSHAVRKDCGAVGPAIWDPNELLQHGGLAVGTTDLAASMHRAIPRNNSGSFGRAVLTQNVTAVSGACLVVRKSVYEEAGGFDEELGPNAVNVDFCLRLRKLGLWNVYAPFAEMRQPKHHHEETMYPDDAAFLRKKWGDAIDIDPFHSPNLSKESARLFELAFPPRIGIFD